MFYTGEVLEAHKISWTALFNMCWSIRAVPKYAYHRPVQFAVVKIAVVLGSDSWKWKILFADRICFIQEGGAICFCNYNGAMTK